MTTTHKFPSLDPVGGQVEDFEAGQVGQRGRGDGRDPVGVEFEADEAAEAAKAVGRLDFADAVGAEVDRFESAQTETEIYEL